MKSIKVMITGDLACFTRPEMKAERVSYDVPTPGALEGLLKAIYWKPSMRYVIDKIVVFNPVEFISIRRNEVKSKVSFQKMKQQMNEAKSAQSDSEKLIKTDPRIYTSSDRTQRSSLVLKNVRYGVEFHIELTGLRNEREKEEGNPLVKHNEIFIRRCKKGQCFREPCLGCSEFPADVQLVDDFDLSQVSSGNRGEKDLGFMLYKVCFKDHGHPIKDDWEKNLYSDEADSVFYRPMMIDGVIDVEKYKGSAIC